MFTGIVRAMGRVEQVAARGGDVELLIGFEEAAIGTVAVGDSLCVSGVCLTVTRLEPAAFAMDVSRETLRCTMLGDLAAGAAVNLEPALRAGDALGGHYVTGHVDGVARVVDVAEEARSARVRFEVPAALARYVAAKGSVTLDGVSLTVNDVAARVFGVNLIPYTREVTTLGALRPGGRVNMEVDIIARYVERLTAGDA